MRNTSGPFTAGSAHEHRLFRRGRLRAAAAFVAALPLAAGQQQPGEGGGDIECWSGDFNWALCCGAKWGLSGNPICWDEEFTYLRCCGLDGFPRRPEDDVAWDQVLAESDLLEAGEFDFIIVGAGSAGSVLAARLATASGHPEGLPWSVLLLEGGPDIGGRDEEPNPDKLPTNDSLWTEALPVTWSAGPGVEHTWFYKTGRGLGGTSLVNSMIYTRGCLGEFASIGWPESEVLQAYRALEKAMEVPGFAANAEYHLLEEGSTAAAGSVGDSMRLGYHVSLVSATEDELPLLFRRLYKAFDAAGVPFRLDPHGSSSMFGVGGIWRSMGCAHDRCQPSRLPRFRFAMGRPRSSPFQEMVAPIIAADSEDFNLTVRADTTVQRIKFGPGAEAIGVEAVVSGDPSSKRRFFRAKREVIVTAGVFGSPKLLTVSGVAEPEELRRLGVPLVSPSPSVGRHLHEHVGLSLVVQTSMPCPAGYHGDAEGKTTHLGSIQDFIAQVYAFLNATDNVAGASGPLDAEIMVLEGCLEGALSLTFTIILLQALTRGRVVVQSRNPATPLHLDYKALSNSEDIDQIARVIRFLYMKVFSHAGLMEFAFAANPPWETVADFYKLAWWIRTNLYHYAHPMGTCRITPAGSSEGVVDSHMRVLGTKRLRVADASIFPSSPSGHSDGPARLVGELASRFILRDWATPAGSSRGMLEPAVRMNGYRGVRMPLRGVGTAGFEGSRARDAVLSFLQLGGRHVDTALLYNNHREIREALALSGVPRGDVFLVSKVPPGEMGSAETEKAIHRMVEELGTHVDLLLLHWPAAFDDKVPLPPCARTPGSWASCRVDAWLAMERAFREGKARSLGVSNFGVKHLQPLLDEPRRTLPIAANQIELHPWWPQTRLRAFCTEQRIAIIAYGSLGGSLIGGAMLNAPSVAKVAAAHGRSSAQVLLRWALQLGAAVIPSTSSEERRKLNLEIVGWELSGAEVAEIIAVNPQDYMRLYLPDPEFAP